MRLLPISTVICAALACDLLAASVSARDKSRAATSQNDAAVVELVPAKRSDLERIEIEMPDPRLTRAPRRPISDVMISLSSGRGDVRQVWTGRGGTGIAGEQQLFRARMMVVSGGRLHRGAQASCGGFERELSICTVDCDGGRFGLRRRAGATGAMDLIVGELPGRAGDAEAGEPAGFAMNSCALDQASEIMIVPKSNTPTAEIALGTE